MSSELTTEKIPDFILLREANIEIGKLKAYIEELEQKIANDAKLTGQDKTEIKKGEYYVGVKNKIKTLELKIKELRKENTRLFHKTLSLDVEYLKDSIRNIVRNECHGIHSKNPECWGFSDPFKSPGKIINAINELFKK